MIDPTPMPPLPKSPKLLTAEQCFTYARQYLATHPSTMGGFQTGMRRASELCEKVAALGDLTAKRLAAEIRKDLERHQR